MKLNMCESPYQVATMEVQQNTEQILVFDENTLIACSKAHTKEHPNLRRVIVGAVIVIEDGNFLCLGRPQNKAELPGALSTPAGHANLSDIDRETSVFDPRLGILRELTEETRIVQPAEQEEVENPLDNKEIEYTVTFDTESPPKHNIFGVVSITREEAEQLVAAEFVEGHRFVIQKLADLNTLFQEDQQNEGEKDYKRKTSPVFEAALKQLPQIGQEEP
jgi:hypothetical protein